MKLLVDMNLSRLWVAFLQTAGFEAVGIMRGTQSALEQGAIVTIDREQMRTRVLPLGAK